jgi:hypothetical protein
MNNADTVATKSMVNANLSLRERVSIALQSYGTQEIRCSIDDLVGKTGITKGQSIYQVLYRMERQGRLEILTENIPGTNRQKFAGVFLKKLEDAADILERVPERINGSKNKVVRREEIRVKEVVPTLLSYMEKKIVIENIRKQLVDAQLDPDQIHFDTDQYAEEGILLLNEWVSINKAYAQMLVEIETLRRENEVLRGSKIVVPDDEPVEPVEEPQAVAV